MKLPSSCVLLLALAPSLSTACSSDPEPTPSDMGGAGGSGAAGSGGTTAGTGGTAPIGGGGSGTSDSGSDAHDPDAGFPNIDPKRTIADLTDAEKGELCDWENASLGGYGLVTDCGGAVTVRNATDRADCVATRLTYRCPLTVGHLTSCIVALAPTHGCTFVESECHWVVCQ